MSATRLLVLGVVHLTGGAHGYQVRTELQSRTAEDWARIKPGSIYHALKKAARDGYLTEAATEPGRAGPERTLYSITDAGLVEIVRLTRAGLLDVDDPTMLPAALAMIAMVERDEAIALLTQRQETLRGKLAELRHWGDNVDQHTPECVAEHVDLWAGQIEENLRWAASCVRRLRAGRYALAGESG